SPGQETAEPPDALEPSEAPEAAETPTENHSASEATGDVEFEKRSATCQDLDARWKAILGLEAAIDTSRINMESLLTELDTELKRNLTVEEKLHASRADVASWTKAKTRVHHALPKVRECIHRSTWAMGAPERKQLDEVYKNHIEPQI